MAQTPYGWRTRLEGVQNRLVRHHMVRAVLANTGWLLLDKLFRIAIAIVVGAWVARHLGPAAYGELAYVLALLGLFQAACALGLDGTAVRDIAQEPERTSVILGSALGLRVGAGLVGWAAAVVVVTALRPGDTAAAVMVIIAGAALVFQPAEVVDLWLQSQSLSRVSVPFRLGAYLLVASFKVMLILMDAPLWAFAAAVLIDAILVGVALRWAYAQRPSAARWQWEGSSAKRLLAECWPFMLSAVSIWIYMRIDQVMLREFADERQLGLYSAVMPFSQAWHVVPVTLCASLLPRLAQLRQDSPQRYEVRLQQAFTAMAWSGVAAAGLTALCAPWLVPLLLGAAFADAVPVLQWHALTNIFVFMGVAQGLALVNDRTPRTALLKTLAGAIVSVIVNFLLIPRWGALGSAWAAAVSYLCSAVLSNLVVAPHAFRMQIRALVPFFHGRF